jgi:long-chain acyl-CoA synthetase
MAPEIDHALAVSEARALLAHVERDEDLAASQRVRQLAVGRITYGERSGAGLTFEELSARDRKSRLGLKES